MYEKIPPEFLEKERHNFWNPQEGGAQILCTAAETLSRRCSGSEQQPQRLPERRAAQRSGERSVEGRQLTSMMAREDREVEVSQLMAAQQSGSSISIQIRHQRDIVGPEYMTMLIAESHQPVQDIIRSGLD